MNLHLPRELSAESKDERGDHSRLLSRSEIASDEELDAPLMLSRKSVPRSKRFLYATLAAITLLLLTTLDTILLLLHRRINSHIDAQSLGSTYHQSAPTITPSSILQCGRNPTEALTKYNCIFDLLDYSFVPAPCYNTTISKYYLASIVSPSTSSTASTNHPLINFYSTSDPNLTTPLPIESILNGRHEYVFSTRPFHALHCEYYLDRLVGVGGFVSTTGWATSLMRNGSYARHCLDEVMGKKGEERTMERMFMGFHYEKCAFGVGYLEPAGRGRIPAELREFIKSGAGNDPLPVDSSHSG